MAYARVEIDQPPVHPGPDLLHAYSFEELICSIVKFFLMIFHTWADMDRYENAVFAGTIILIRVARWTVEAYLELGAIKYKELTEYIPADTHC